MVKLSKIQLLSASVLLALAMVVFFGPVHAMGMEPNENGQMSGCPFMGMETLCRMGIFEHIRTFQSIFSGIPVKAFSFVLFLFIFAFFAITIVAPRINSPPSKIMSFAKEVRSLFIFDKTLKALSDGVIQPKIYT